MRWQASSDYVRLWRASTEVEAVRVGEMFATYNIAVRRWWHFKLVYRGEEVLRWDISPVPRSHRNVRCVGFPARIRGHDQEHVWTPGRGTACAVTLHGFERATHRQVLEAFAQRANICSLPDYEEPIEGEQLRL
jgi:hypothetical protein